MRIAGSHESCAPFIAFFAMSGGWRVALDGFLSHLGCPRSLAFGENGGKWGGNGGGMGGNDTYFPVWEMGGHDTYFPVWRRVPILRFFYRKVRLLFLTLVSNRQGNSE